MSRWHTRQPVARKSLRDTLTDNLAAFKSNGRPADPVRAARYDGQVARWEEQIASLGPKRERKPRVPGVDIDRAHKNTPLERNVIKAAMQALRLDRRVARVERNQSGVFQEGDRWIKVGVRGKLDITIYLKDGRYIEAEAKRPGKKPEPHQKARIEQIKRDGGMAGWFDSIETALALLP